MYKLIGIFLLSMGIANAQTDSGMDYNGVNPGNDKKQCLSIEECPEWNGDPDTKVFYDLNKGLNGTGKVENVDNLQIHRCKKWCSIS